jgi:hypothetical protein
MLLVQPSLATNMKRGDHLKKTKNTRRMRRKLLGPRIKVCGPLSRARPRLAQRTLGILAGIAKVVAAKSQKQQWVSAGEAAQPKPGPPAPPKWWSGARHQQSGPGCARACRVLADDIWPGRGAVGGGNLMAGMLIGRCEASRRQLKKLPCREKNNFAQR